MIKLIIKTILFFYPKLKDELFSVKFINDKHSEMVKYKIEKKSPLYKSMIKELKLSELFIDKVNSLFLFNNFSGPVIDKNTCRLIGFYYDGDLRKDFLRQSNIPGLVLIDWEKVKSDNFLIKYKNRKCPGVYSFGDFIFQGDYLSDECVCDLVSYGEEYIVIKIKIHSTVNLKWLLSRDDNNGISIIGKCY